MKSTLKAKDLTKKDGFPDDIDRSRTVVVQIVGSALGHNICCYINKSGGSANWELPNELSFKYHKGIYVINR